METPRNEQAFYECPRFQRCGCNDCPLDMQMGQRGPVLDSDEKCKATRATRVAIAARYSALPTGGLKRSEIARDARRARRRRVGMR